MTDIQTYELAGLKLSLAVRRGKQNPAWTVQLNDNWIYGSEKISYHLAVEVYDAVKQAIAIIAREKWDYVMCNHCNLLVPSIAQTMVWYTNEDTGERSGYTENICVACERDLSKSGGLEK